MEEAAKRTKKQSPRWRQSDEQTLRKWAAQSLMPIFEKVFEEGITVNNWPSDPRHKQPTPFMDFYLRVMALAFSEKRPPNLTGVLREAVKQRGLL